MLAHTVLVYMARITQLTDLVVFSSTSSLELFAHNMYLFPNVCVYVRQSGPAAEIQFQMKTKLL